MVERNVSPVEAASQAAALQNFISDLRSLRRKLVTSERFHKGGVLAGELLLLASHYQSGKRPSTKKLKRFLWFITERAA
jgi:hypothetical protein